MSKLSWILRSWSHFSGKPEARGAVLETLKCHLPEEPSNRVQLCHTPGCLSCLLSTQRQRLINSANGVSSKPLQNGRHDSIENGNVPVENLEEPQRDQEPPPQPLPPPQEPEPVEAAFLSPFSMPGESWGPGLSGHTARGSRVPSLGLQDGELDSGRRGAWCEGPTLSHSMNTSSVLNCGLEPP